MKSAFKKRIILIIWLAIAITFFWCLNEYRSKKEPERLFIEVISDKELHEIELE